jgi:2-polyprenyl-3-methyl-5-hydroxy-6-metoxy-1,4-benzoquinol methylase
MDKAGKKYWDDAWNEAAIPGAWNPQKGGLNNYVQKRFDEYFKRIFKALGSVRGKKLLEVGCANSASLPYFAREFGFEVTGIDYSEIGCEGARNVLKRECIKGTIYCEDFFAPSKNLIGQFDVVVSFGVVEHFQDTAGCIAALSILLKPGGIMITAVPNMTGTIGYFLKILNPCLLEMHVQLDKNSLSKAHNDAGLKVLECDYFISTNYGICNLAGLPTTTISWHIKKIIIAALARFSMATWILESRVGAFKAARTMSAYINCLARKKY